MNKPSGIDARDQEEGFVYQVLLLKTGKEFTREEIKRLEKHADFGNEIVPSPVYLIENDPKYIDYLDYIGKLSKKYKWSRATIINLLLSPTRPATGWLDQGGSTISRTQWKLMQN